MYKKLVYLISFVVVLVLAGNVQAAATVFWNDADPLDHLWSTSGNWSLNDVPTMEHGWVKIGSLPGPTIVNEGAVANSGIQVGYSGVVGALTVDGGTLTTNGGIYVPNQGEGTLNMNSGDITAKGGLNIGQGGSGTLNMYSGTFTIPSDFRIGRDTGGVGHVNLNGGILTAEKFVMGDGDSVGTMSVGAGTLIIEGDVVSKIQGYIDDPNGWITAYDDNGILQLDYNVTNEGKTTLKATHSFNPNPVDGGTIAPGEIELSWTLPDPCVPGEPVQVDVYLTDDYQALYTFADPASIQVISRENVISVVMQVESKTSYYWAIDTYVGDPNDPILGPIFSFFTDNLPPQVDAGADVVAWLEGGPMTGELDATVTDEEAYTVQWTVVSEPNENSTFIETVTAEDTSITLSVLGEYVLQLEALDGEYTGSDTITINVYNDNCEATQSLPDYVPLVGDLNGDCKVDDVDLALLQENWLKDNLLSGNWFKVE